MKIRKRFNKVIMVIVVLILCFGLFHSGFKEQENNQWLGSWNVSATNFINMKNNGHFNYENQTLRTIVTLSYGGIRERVKLSNEYGTEALEIGASSVALVDSDGTLQSNTINELTFNGLKNVVINKGEYIWSDPIDMEVNAQDKIAISIYLPNKLNSVTGGCGNVQAYISEPGDYTSLNSTNMNYEPIEIGDYANVSLFLTSVEVDGPDEDGTIVIFGDSISAFSWPEHLTSKLVDNGISSLSVIREAIVGNRILYDTPQNLHGLFGPSGISRFEEAITCHTGTRYVVALEGANDIMSTGPGGTSPASEVVEAEQVIGGLQKYIDLAHKHDLKIYGATIMPFAGYITYTEEEESVRQEVNDWIRNTAQYDAVFDFDKVTRNPDNINQLLPQYDSGDHVHPSDAGSKAMVDAIDVELFR